MDASEQKRIPDDRDALIALAAQELPWKPWVRLDGYNRPEETSAVLRVDEIENNPQWKALFSKLADLDPQVVTPLGNNTVYIDDEPRRVYFAIALQLERAVNDAKKNLKADAAANRAAQATSHFAVSSGDDDPISGTEALQRGNNATGRKL